ncbi:hypothetical protein [Ruminobacter amylophilus]|uniref:hypothetical protein n=1 Tax=Ruminobacter amylophilus TaxID=867 RepID=UPI003870C97E
MTDAELTAKLNELESRILYLEQQQQDAALRMPKINWIARIENELEGFPFGTWKEYPPTQAAPQAYTDQMTPSYHCTYEHP